MKQTKQLLAVVTITVENDVVSLSCHNSGLKGVEIPEQLLDKLKQTIQAKYDNPTAPDVDLDLLDLQAWIVLKLQKERIYTVNEFLSYKDSEILRTPGFGVKSLEKVHQAIEKYRSK